MNSKKLIPLLLLMIMVLVVSNCKNDKNRIAVYEHTTDIIGEKNLCSEIESKGSVRIFCKMLLSNAVVLSKTDIPMGTKLFVESFSEENKMKGILKYTDSIINCPVDFFIDCFVESVEITDSDDDQVKEITFLYEKACRGGVDPADLYLVKIEGEDVYIVNGKRVLKHMSDSVMNNKYQTSSNFSEAPKVFLDHAIKRWKEYVIEK